MTNTDTNHAWWSRLRHQGMLLSPVVMLERFPDAPEVAPFHKVSKLRDAYTRFVSTTEGRGDDPVLVESAILSWVDAVLQHYVGYETYRLAKQGSIPENLTTAVRIGSRTDTVKPNRVIFADDLGLMPAILVMADTSPHVGRGRGRTVYAKFLELLRGTGNRLGLLTNGFQFRLVYAGLDFESWCEWEVERWFDNGEGSQELAGLRQLLSADSLKPVREKVPGLLDAVEESRKRQADLSSVLRENVRQAVELLTEEVSAAHRTDGRLFELLFVTSSAQRLTDAEAHEALMQASVRIVMRMVVCLFAESRQLLPVNDPIYAQSYGVRTLYELLDEAVRQDGGTHALLTRQTAWPRLMALFRLIYGGSAHGSFTLRAYGGALFRPGKAGDTDHVSRALDLLERHVAVTDATVFAVLRKLLRGPLPVIRGRSKTFVDGPVDYTDLRTEFIGLIYEGLLDYRLKRTDEATGPQIFLNLGREPVLPLSRLQEMLANDPKGLKDLLTTLRKENVTASVASETEEEKEDAEDEVEEESIAEVILEPVVESSTSDDRPRPQDVVEAQNTAIAWAKKAAMLAGLVRKPGKRESNAEYESYVESEAKKLIKKVVSVGEFYLVRAGNTRKGTGTFYTRPQLAVPTVHRTLEPLCYDLNVDGTLFPKTPDVILSLKVCDPACGSASFPVAALHYISEALYKSLCFHCDLDDPDKSMKITLPFGKTRTGKVGEEYVPFPPSDPQHGDRFAERIKALLRRHVVERCIYGVDINPLAVEFARVSLWIETLDPELPFSFLDHKIKVGNALVGCWLDRVADYPLRAWQRNGGDDPDSKTRGPRTEGIETLFKGEKSNGRRSGDGIIKQEMRELIEGRFQKQPGLFADQTATVEQVITAARLEYELLHQIAATDPDERERHYRERIENSRPLKNLKRAMDEWCSVWFWPANHDSLKLVPTPLTFHRSTPEREQIIENLKNERKFFHWEIAFPDVFTADRTGFDAVVGNPPWEVMKPNLNEFFSAFDPLFRGYDKQSKIGRQNDLFSSVAEVRLAWDDQNAFLKAMGNWVRHTCDPFAFVDLSADDEENDQAVKSKQKDRPSLALGKRGEELRRVWEREVASRQGFGPIQKPFWSQGGSDLNLYKLFLELAYRLLTPSGRLGFIVPAGIYTDSGTQELRSLFLNNATWCWLFSFENRKRIFAIHSSFKFCALILDRRSLPLPLRTAFMMHDVADWERSEPPTFEFDRSLISLFSPVSRSLPEVRSERELDVCKRLYENSTQLLDAGREEFKLVYGREFHMGDDAKLFRQRNRCEADGVQITGLGTWEARDGSRYFPLYEGRMSDQFDTAAKAWVSGRGRSAVWVDVEWDKKLPRPQYLIEQKDYERSTKPKRGLKVGIMNITAATNSRTLIANVIRDYPTGDSLYTLQPVSGRIDELLFVVGILNSLSYDFCLRTRLGGLHASEFVLAETPLPRRRDNLSDLAARTAKLSLTHRRFAPDWLRLRKMGLADDMKSWKQQWAVTESDRLRLRIEVDSLIADLYGLQIEDFEWVTRNDPSDPKGFWRVEKELPYPERLTFLAAAAFRAMKESRWSAESSANMSNDDFFEMIGIPEMTSEEAAKRQGLDRPLIYKRNGCHVWEPEKFTNDDPRFGWTWDHCWQDAVALLGSEQAVKDYVDGRSEAVPERESQGKNWLRSDPVETQGKLF